MKTKTLFIALIAIFTISTLSAKPPKNGKLTVAWSFKGLVEGYDHDSKCIIFVDGNKVGESSVTKESISNSITVDAPMGNHSVKVTNYANYEGNWEEHLIANEYSIDCNYSGNVKIKKKTKVTLLFDIDKGTEAKVK